jgi:alkylation response protein AidB-like acyl-CoA dehydrogenase
LTLTGGRSRTETLASPGSVPWHLSEEQRQLWDVAASFARDYVAPRAVACDEAGELPGDAQAVFHETGLATRFLNSRPGDHFAATACLITEELGYACASFASFLMLPVFFNRVVASHLAPGTRASFVAECRAGPVVTSFAASEREAGSDLLALQLLAAKTSNGFRLTGRKEYSSNLRRADYVIVVARTVAGAARSRAAHSWFLVPTSARGVTIGARWPTLGLRAMDLSPLELDDVEIDGDALLGTEGAGLQMMSEHLAQSRTGIAALGVGIARRARDLVVDQARHRRVYGEKLAHQQDYRFRISAMETEIAAARALVRVAAERADAGEDAVREASIAKLFSGEMVMRVTAEAVAMLGSVGYTGQSIVGKLLRDARHVAIVEGPEPIHKEIIFAHLLRHGGY